MVVDDSVVIRGMISRWIGAEPDMEVVASLRTGLDAINQLGERTRFTKGLYAWIGFPSTVVPFVSHDRFVGRSRWSFVKLASFALDGFVSFSSPSS